MKKVENESECAENESIENESESDTVEDEANGDVEQLDVTEEQKDELGAFFGESQSKGLNA